MKKFIYIALALITLAVLSGCGSILHNTPASYVTLEVKNFPVVNGDYCFVGSFNDKSWTNTERSFAVAANAGSFTDDKANMIISGDFFFSIVNKGTWTRSFYPNTMGNSDDYGTMQNFKVTVPMDGGIHKIIVDGSTVPATLTVQ